MNRKRKAILTIMIILAMGLTACSTGQKEESASPGTAADAKEAGTDAENENLEETSPNNGNPEKEESEAEAAESGNPEDKTVENEEDQLLPEEEIPQGDPIIGIVDSFKDDVIVIRDMDDEDIVLYFNTQDAEVIEGDSPIAPGDVVEITYRGVQGDKRNPGMAVKVVAESEMYGSAGEEK